MPKEGAQSTKGLPALLLLGVVLVPKLPQFVQGHVLLFFRHVKDPVHVVQSVHFVQPDKPFLVGRPPELSPSAQSSQPVPSFDLLPKGFEPGEPFAEPVQLFRSRISLWLGAWLLLLHSLVAMNLVDAKRLHHEGFKSVSSNFDTDPSKAVVPSS